MKVGGGGGSLYGPTPQMPDCRIGSSDQGCEVDFFPGCHTGFPVRKGSGDSAGVSRQITNI